MPLNEHKSLAFYRLYTSPMIAVSDYICCEPEGNVSAEEYSTSNSIVLMRRGAFSRHFGRKKVTADVNQAAFFSTDSAYRVSHPSDGGDRGTTLTVADSILRDIVRELYPAVDDVPEKPFPFLTGPCDPEIFWRHREYVRRLEHADSDPLEMLWADVTGLQLIADVLESAFQKRGVRKQRRMSTHADHYERVEAAKAFLASRLGGPVTLDEVADAASASPFNFARMFRTQTGLPVHRYLTLLRLRASLERVASSEDITSVALDLGFSSHSHFTGLFRREFGITPSEFRKRATSAKARKMSKNLIV